MSLRGSPFAKLRDASPVSRLFIYRSVVVAYVSEAIRLTLLLRLLHNYL